MIRRTLWILLPVIGLCLLGPRVAAADCFEFEDGTRQGWLPGEPLPPGYNGLLTIRESGDDHGFYLAATDTVPKGGTLLAQAPPRISGDLSEYLMEWEELLPPLAIYSTDVLIEGSDGTIYHSDRTLQGVEAWTRRWVSFSTPQEWTLLAGSAPFLHVASDVAALYIRLDVVPHTGHEAGVDNICFFEGPVLPTTWGTIKARFALE